MVDRALSLSPKGSDLLNNIGFCGRLVGEQRLMDVLARLDDQGLGISVKRLDGALLGSEGIDLRVDHAAQQRIGCVDSDVHFRHRCRGLGSIKFGSSRVNLIGIR